MIGEMWWSRAMTVKSGSRPVRRGDTRAQERGERTRALVIDETVRCIREEGFAAASTRHIIDRAGVSWGVIQYYFGDRDGLLSAVIDDALTTLIASLQQLVKDAAEIDDPHQRADTLTAAAWGAFFSPTCMTALEILIATRAMRGTLDADKLSGLTAAIANIAEVVGDSTPYAAPIGNLVWSSPVGMMVAQMVMTDPISASTEQSALAVLIGEHLAAHQPKAPAKPRSRRRSR
jgi:TetR/AcrR family transcriptional regulator, regulator of cefoperazone and chloramphenicol sensitivity